MYLKDKKEFFNNLATEMGIPDIKDAENYYYAMLRYIIRTTKRDGFCKAPDLGKFEIRVFSGKRRRNLHGLKYQQNVTKDYYDPIRVMKIIFDPKIKRYIND